MHVQITTDLRGKLNAGTIPAGTALPMASLAQQWGVCRETVRKALRALENDGLIKRYPQHGYRTLPAGSTTPATEGTQPMTPHRQRAATDHEKAVARELAAQLKPALDQIDGKLDTILRQITALKQAAAARRDGHPTQGGNGTP
jgi:DNA-binding GntR family transcriptional regulator